jgi:hypothetical protein
MIPGLRILTLSDKGVESFYDQARIKSAQSYGSATVAAKGEYMQMCTPNLSLVTAGKSSIFINCIIIM